MGCYKTNSESWLLFAQKRVEERTIDECQESVIAISMFN